MDAMDREMLIEKVLTRVRISTAIFSISFYGYRTPRRSLSLSGPVLRNYINIDRAIVSDIIQNTNTFLIKTMENLLIKLIRLHLLLVVTAVSAQLSVKRLNDPAIVAQHKRMVFESWGDWRPYPKYFLGVQTNLPMRFGECGHQNQ
jgi:hypothetical protein